MNLLFKSSRTITLLVLLLAVALSAGAHEIKPAIVDLNHVTQATEKHLAVNIVVNLESLMAEIGPDHDDTDQSENSALYESLRSMDGASLTAEFDGFEARFLRNVSVQDESGTDMTLALESLDIPDVGNVGLPRDSIIVLRAPLTEDALSLTWQWDKSFGEVIVRANSDSHDIDYATLLPPGQRSDTIHFNSKNQPSVSSILTNYIKLGFIHILPKGWDHILFVVGLFLLTPKWRPLLAQVTTFTVAHSITLALGASNLLRISPDLVEPLIALSIVFVCVENLIANRLNKWRITTVFVFGLLHGMGFASVLEGLGLSSTNYLVSLLGFNLGVELGQLTVIAFCLGLFGLWLGKKSNYRSHFSKPASVLVGIVGLYWFVQRVMP